jgi:hypothetical protein
MDIEYTCYNYCCISDDCKVTHNIQIELETDTEDDNPQQCYECNSTLKCIGISTQIVHKGTQESKS